MSELLRAFVLVVVGLAGDPEHGELFDKWGQALVDTSQAQGIPAERIIQLHERTTRADVEQAFSTLAGRMAADDVLFICLIGHGSFDGRAAKFNLRGPDMVPADFAALLDRLPTSRVVFVNTTSASGPFLEALAAPGRTVIAATRSGAEQYTTLFPGYFVGAFATEEADADKNRRVTVLEAFEYAQREVASVYEREGLLATEHARIDDAGKMAAGFSLGTGGDDDLPSDPQLRALHLERRQLERRVEALTVLKGSMEPARYAAELERLAVAIALKRREIRTLEESR